MRKTLNTVGLISVYIISAGLFAGCAGKKVVKPEVVPMQVSKEVEPQAEKESKSYVVTKGDTLWGISGKSETYSDHFQWPLIFKANRDQIEDPDLIYPDQTFTIQMDLSEEEINQAVENAKNTPRYKAHTKPRKKLPVEY